MGTPTTLTGAVLTPEEFLINATIEVTEGIITALDGDPCSPEECFASHKPGQGKGDPLLLPAAVDLHNHGGRGGSFPTSDLPGCRRAIEYHHSQGTGTMLASLVTAPIPELLKRINLLVSLCEEGLLAGIHLEGPFISTSRCGAHDPELIIPSEPSLLKKLFRAGQGFIKSVTFAPEITHYKDFMELCAEYSVIASLGHTEADYAHTRDVIQYGELCGTVMSATHLFNAMPGIHHRNPGPITAFVEASRRGSIDMEIIADHNHVHDAVVDMTFQSSPHLFAITDAMAAAGQPDGMYQLGGLEVEVRGGIARLSTEPSTDPAALSPALGAIAGGTSTLGKQYVDLLDRGWSLSDAHEFCYARAARLLNRVMSEENTVDHSIRVGNRAHIFRVPHW